MPPEIIVTIVVGIVTVLAFSAIVIVVDRRLRTGGFRRQPYARLTMLGILWRVLLALMLAGLLLVPMVMLMGPVLGIITWLVLLFTIVEVWRKFRASKQYGLLWLLTVSAERSMPLAPAIEAFARERRGGFSRRAKRLAETLNAGVPLPEALDQCPALLPRYAVPTIRVGCESGTLAQALRRAATVHNLDEPFWMSLQGKFAYLLILPVFGLVAFLFVMIQIVPQFIKIFQDFGADLPAMTVALIGMAHWVSNYMVLVAPFYMFAAALLLYFPMRYFGWIDWDLPGMGWLTRRLDSAEILDSLSLVAAQQRPMTQGIASLAQSYPKRHIRRRLSQAQADIALGGDWCESLRRHDLIRQPELAILQAAQRVGNLPWALTEMADSVRRRLGYRVQAIAQLLFPPIVILMGLGVLFIVVALFMPLIELIQRLA